MSAGMMLDENLAARAGEDYFAFDFYRHMAESHAAPAVLVADPADDYRLLHVSAACRCFGLSPEMSLGKALAECLPALTSIRLEQLWLEVSKSGSASLEVDMCLESGSRIAGAIVFSLLQQDRRQLMFGYLRDLGQRRAVEAECLHPADEIASREVELRYREIYENVTDGIFLLDVVDGRFRHAGINPAMARMAGLVSIDILGRFVEESVPEDTAQKMIANYRRCVEEGKAIEYEVELELPSGRKNFASALIPVRDGLGHIHRIIGLTRDITERKQAEQRIVFMNFTLDRMNDAVFLIDSQFGFRYVNDQACRSLGYSRDELLGMRVPDIDPGVDTAKAQAIQSQTFEQRHIRFETFHRTKDGHDFPVEISGTVFEYGGETMSLAVARDISERKRAEAESRRLIDILEESPDFIGSADLQGNLRYHNPAALRMVGLPKDADLSAMQIPDMHPVWATKLIQETAIPTLLAESAWRGETALLHRDGREIPVSQLLILHRNALGKPEFMSTIIQDITERKQREAIIAERLEFERRFSRMAEHIPGFLYTFKIDANGKACFPYTSSGIRDIYGLQPEDVADDMTPLHSMAHPDDQPRIEAAIAESVRTMKQFHQEVRVIHPVKGEIWVQAISMPVREPDGSILAFGVMLDITERKRVENTLSFIAQTAWKDSGEPFLTALAQYLGRTLGVDYVIIDRLADNPDHAETVAIYARGEVLPNMQYSLKGTPCENVMAGGLCWYPDNVQRQFPEDVLLVEMRVESYAGLPLRDSTGKVIGLIAAMDGKSMGDAAGVESILQLVATSAAAELERRCSEQMLLESKLFLNRVIDTLPDPVFVKDRQHRWVMLNQAFCQFIGRPLEDLLGKSDFDFFPLHEAEVFWAMDEAVFLSGKENVNEEAFTGGDGNVRTIVTKKTCYQDESGQQILVGIILDITERKSMELALAAREQELRSLAESSPGMMGSFHLRPDGSVCMPYVSPNIWELFGLHPLDVADDASPLMALNHPGDAERVSEAIIESARTMTVWHQEYRILHPTRGERWMEGHTKPEPHPDGGIVWYGYVHDITERIKVQEALQNSRALLEEAQRIGHIGCWDVDIVNDVLTWSDETFRIWEIDKTHFEATFAAFLATVHPEDREKVTDAYNDSIKNKALYQVEHRLLFADGRVKYIAERGEPFYDEAGRPIRFVGVSQDITERKEMELKVRQREEEFRILVERSPDPIFRYDRDCRRIYVNPAVESMTGKSAADLLNRLPSDASIVSLHEGEKLLRFIRQVLETGRAAESDVEFVALSGQHQYFHNRYAPEFGPNGETIGVITMARDITERKLAEIQLQQREREFRTLVENLPTVVVRYDRNFHRVYANPAYWQIAGRIELGILGKPVGVSWRATNISAESYTAILAEVMNSGRKVDVSLEWSDVNGRLITHAMKIVPEYDANERVTGVLALGFDISERRQQQLVEANRLCVFEKMAQGDDLNSILEQVALYVESSKPGQHCCILMLDEDCKQLQTVVAPSFPASYRAKLNPVVLAEESRHCFGWVASALRCERVVLDDVRQHLCGTACQGFIREVGAVACWSEPILSSSNQLLGIVSLYLNQSGEPNETDLAMLRQAGHLSSIAIERKRIEDLMCRQASYDLLTGLPNRRMLIDRLHEQASKCRRNGSLLSLLFIDLDRFKEVNDTLGHQYGDLLLAQAAERIRNGVRESDFVARLAGDEFVVLITHSVDNLNANLVGQHIVDVMSERFLLGTYTAHISASVGIACYPTDTDDIDQLLGCADQSMYAVKKAGRSGVSFFTRSLQDEAQERLQLSNDLRSALQEGQLQVHYQPIVNVKTGKADKAEALIRWHHPQRGMVRPDLFIPLAEESGAIHEIGDWVFRQAAGVALQWQTLSAETGHCAKTCQISVNMSPRQFIRGTPDVAWINHLQLIGLNPEAIVIEITEGLLLDDQAYVTNKLSSFQQAGMQLALDDFGTGYSAMAYLKKFNIDYLKIDRSFVRDLETDPGDRAIAEAIVAMAHRLGLKVIAEGVETEGQQDLLAAVGCEYVQGYLYARPMPANDFLAYVKAEHSEYLSMGA